MTRLTFEIGSAIGYRGSKLSARMVNSPLRCQLTYVALMCWRHAKAAYPAREPRSYSKTEDYTHQVCHCYKCGTIIQPLLMDQWFVRIKPLADAAIKLSQPTKLRFTPPARRVSSAYLSQLRDWNISANRHGVSQYRPSKTSKILRIGSLIPGLTKRRSPLMARSTRVKKIPLTRGSVQVNGRIL